MQSGIFKNETVDGRGEVFSDNLVLIQISHSCHNQFWWGFFCFCFLAGIRRVEMSKGYVAFTVNVLSQWSVNHSTPQTNVGLVPLQCAVTGALVGKLLSRSQLSHTCVTPSSSSWHWCQRVKEAANAHAEYIRLWRLCSNCKKHERVTSLLNGDKRSFHSGWTGSWARANFSQRLTWPGGAVGVGAMDSNQNIHRLIDLWL